MVKIKTNISYSPIEPLRIVDSKSPVFFFSGDLGVTIGTGVSAWADQSGNGRNATQATGGNQPAYSATGLNSKGVITFDGTDDHINIAYIPPAPATTPSWYWIVFNPLVGATGATFFASNNTSRHRFYWASTTTTSINCANAVDNSSTTAATWYRAEVFFNNSTTDYKKIGVNKVTGNDAGNNAGATNFTIGAINTTPTSPSNVSIACFGCWAGEPTANEKTALDMWVQRYYGGSVII